MDNLRPALVVKKGPQAGILGAADNHREEKRRKAAATGMGERQIGGAAGEAAGIRTFLIADVRGYTLFTQERGDEAAAKLAARFAGIAREVVEEHGGSVVELRGDEALVVFTSARQPSSPRPTRRPASWKRRSPTPRFRSPSGSGSTPVKPSPSKAVTGAAR